MAERREVPRALDAGDPKRKRELEPAQQKHGFSKRSRRNKDTGKHDLDAPHQSTIIPHDKYHIGWICPLAVELAAAVGMLDKIYERLPQPFHDTNTYTLGNIAGHNVVVACLPAESYGTNNAAIVATHMRRTFSSICIWLLVGIGGGAPGKFGIRLGDVAVSTQVLQNDFGKLEQGSHLRQTGLMRTSSQALMTAVATLRAKQTRSTDMASHLHQMLEKHPSMTDYVYPGANLDLLFDSGYEHESQSRENCDTCDRSRLVLRDARTKRDPVVHYGTIASANHVLRDAVARDQVVQKLDNICFEMEAAGVMESCSSIVIRGISDYADSHKNGKWQAYAAATAAAYAEELLSIIPLKDASLAEARLPMQTEKRPAARRSQRPPSGKVAPQHAHRIRNVRAGDDAHQMFLSKGTPLHVEKVVSRNRGVQVFGDISLQDVQEIVHRRNDSGAGTREQSAEEDTARSMTSASGPTAI
ncbi:hypothetical protein QQS21_011261 [Conoideocrella luteorostrata]|uniref:Nucleoside phosphorylase domain-containing protein n=1 Tax=Conoideocrella luteorostrata TaxID=1105319 RepID=A0AAJ0CEH1_9HYPO|nr:hypothetical protein QQS21_011261 [Conoideocrella luteorostrata]